MTESTALSYRVQLFAQEVRSHYAGLKFQNLVKSQVVMSVMSECISVNRYASTFMLKKKKHRKERL